MGNCLKGGASTEDVSLITDNNHGDHIAGLSSQGYLQVSLLASLNLAQFVPQEKFLTRYISIFFHQPSESANQSSSANSLPILYPAPCTSSRLLSHYTEEEQIQLAKRIGLIQHLPTGTYDGGGSSKKSRECVICMVEFVLGDSIRFLPCMHTYHVECIDDWLMRSFICPSCMEPVDAALLSTFQ